MDSSFLISKKEDGKCFFLQSDNSCQIQEVKPMDCLMWPLTFEFDPITNEITLCLGSCTVTSYLRKNRILKRWLREEVEILIKNLYKFSKDDLINYNLLPDIKNPVFLERKISFNK